MAVGRDITVEEFELLPLSVAKNQELVGGALVDVSGNTAGHNFLRGTLLALLAPLIKSQQLGQIICEQDFDFDGNVHGPDVALIGADKLPLIELDRRVQLFVPDLAIEIDSGHETFVSLMGKLFRYRKCGTKEVWLFSIPSRMAIVFSNDRQLLLDQNQMFESKLIPGLSIRIGDLFDQA